MRMCRLNHVIRSRHCVHRHLHTRSSRHHHWQRVYHFCFQDSIWTPSETDLPSSDQLGCRWSTRRSRRSCRSGDPQNPGNWYQIAECLVGPSSLWFVCFTDVSRSYFARTRLCRVLAATSSSHKHSSLLLSIVTVWAIGLCTTGLCLLTVYHADVDTLYAVAATDLVLLISLGIICASYLSIRSRLYATQADVQDGQRRSTRDQNIRLSKTFYLVVAVSLIFWLPGFLVYTINEFCPQCFSSTLLWFGNVLHLANSMVNPLVYSFRMKIFKDALKKCWKKRFDLRPVSRSVQNAPQEFITYL